MTNKELSFGYIKSESIGGPCEVEVRRQIEQHDLELLWAKMFLWTTCVSENTSQYYSI